jgi:KDO2-lipid IV(A) lauroyltransferase
LARWILRQLNFLVPELRRRMSDHLRLVYGRSHSVDERARMAQRVQDNLGATLAEFMRLAHRRPEDLRHRTRTFGQIHLRRALDAGHGVLLVTAHYGSYELAGAYCAAHGLPITVLARARDDVLTEQFVGRTRSQHQIRVIHKTAWREALKVLRDGGLVGVLADQAVNTGGVMADFLDQPAATAVGPILMAQQTGAALLPCFVTRDNNGRLTVELHAPIELPSTGDEEADLCTAAQRLNDVLSAQIRHRPEEWQWLHRRWKTPRSIRRRAPKLDRSMAAED